MIGSWWAWFFGDTEWGKPPPGNVEPIVERVPLRLGMTPLDTTYIRRGVYGTAGDYMPKRALFAGPWLTRAMRILERKYPGVFFYSDIYRTPQRSREIFIKRKGALPPGWSTHNFGMAVDIDTRRARKGLIESGFDEFKGKDWKLQLDLLLAEVGLFCFRTDNRIKREEWHYYAFPHGVDWIRPGDRSRYRAGERMIQSKFGHVWKSMTATEVQSLLHVAGFDPGKVDGVLGKKTERAVRKFQKKWKLGRLRRKSQRARPGVADLTTRRVLAVVTATRGER